MSCLTGLQFHGWYSWSTPIIAFVLIPLIELLLPARATKRQNKKSDSIIDKIYFDLILFLNIPLLYYALYLYFTQVGQGHLISWDLAGNSFAVGILLGGFGINIGHELGHRKEWFYQLGAALFLIPNLYLHFNIVHNLWHHKWVATPKDAASATKGMNIFHFWYKSVFANYRQAWLLANQIARRHTVPLLNNRMIFGSILCLCYLIGVGGIFGWQVIPYAIIVAIIGVLLLESVNYIEHYGLSRKMLENGRYEAVNHRHSWNSNHELGRIFLFELVLHTDHHMHAYKEYQTLEHVDGSPQLAYGYPASILLAMIPPLWFMVMDKKISQMS